MTGIQVFFAVVFGMVLLGILDAGLGATIVGGFALGAFVYLWRRVRTLSATVEHLVQRLDRFEKQESVSNKPESVSKVVDESMALSLDDDLSQVQTSSEPWSASSVAIGESTVEKAFTWARNWLVRYFTEGNLIVRVGVLVLLFGVGFLVKYAAERTQIPVSLRLWGIVLAGCAMMAAGWYLRHRRYVYALALQGGGLGVVYLTLYGALRLYGAVSPGMALALMIVLVALGCVASIWQNAQILAGLALTGGFLAPVLTSTGQGGYETLFTYYLVLNAGIAAMAWYRAWRGLNLLGFGFTYVIAGVWGAFEYRPADYVGVQTFVVIFFLLYVAIAILFALRQPPKLRGLVDGTLVFGVPVITFAIQAMLLDDSDYGLAWSSALMALFYGAATWGLGRFATPGFEVMRTAFLGLAVGFATLTIPLAFGERWTAAIWAAEALGLVWVGARQDQRLPIIGGLLLFVGAGLALIRELAMAAGGAGWLFLSMDYLGGALIALTALAGARLLAARYPQRDNWRYYCGLGLLAYGLTWAVGIGAFEIERIIDRENQWAANLVYQALLAAGLTLWQQRIRWTVLELLPVASLASFCLGALLSMVHTNHPFAGAGILGLPAIAAVLVWQLRIWQVEGWQPRLRQWITVVSGWVGVALLVVELHWQVTRLTSHTSPWPQLSLIVIPWLVLVAVTRARFSLARINTEMYLGVFAVPLVIGLLVWLLSINLGQPGDAGFGYLPVLNPWDLGSLLVFWGVWQWWVGVRVFKPFSEVEAAKVYWFAGGLAFLWLNASLLRTLFLWTDMPWTVTGIMGSVVAQASLSIVWTALGLVTAVYAARGGSRTVWIAGAALIAVVVVKLFLVDLAGTGTLARVVSFLGVGGLLLLVGYFAPMPERTARSPE